MKVWVVIATYGNDYDELVEKVDSIYDTYKKAVEYINTAYECGICSDDKQIQAVILEDSEDIPAYLTLRKKPYEVK